VFTANRSGGSRRGFLGEKGLPRMPIEPDPGLLEAARQLGAVSDFLVVPSNGPHLLQAEIERAAGRRS
jgi:hypothetical protein